MKQDDFFVGYLPIPGTLANFFKGFIPVVLILVLGLAAVLGFSSPEAGGGTWNLEETVTVTGRLRLDPYPMIVSETYGDRPVLVVSGVKLSARPVLEGRDGEMVTVKGNMISRGNWRMLTVDDATWVSDGPPAGPAFPQVTVKETVSLKGEVVDSKCMLGAMRPGVGQVHRACASLCVAGGLPPMLLVRRGADHVAYLIVGPNGEALHSEMSRIVATPVALSGQLELWGEMPVIRTLPSDVRLLDGAELAAFGPSIGTGEGPEYCTVFG